MNSATILKDYNLCCCFVRREIEKGKYAKSDVFACYETIIPKREVLLLSDQRAMYCVKNDLFGGWQVRKVSIHSLKIVKYCYSKI